MPLASSTRASGTASAASSIVTTGITGESVSTAVASWGLLMASLWASKGVRFNTPDLAGRVRRGGNTKQIDTGYLAVQSERGERGEASAV